MGALPHREALAIVECLPVPQGASLHETGLVWRNLHNSRKVRIGESVPSLPLLPAIMSYDTAVQIAIWMSVLFGLIVVAWLVVQRFRGGAADVGQSESQILTKFQEMRQEGDISEAEYRTIKSVLGEQLQRNVKDGKNKG